jgi:hypothetical protein
VAAAAFRLKSFAASRTGPAPYSCRTLVAHRLGPVKASAVCRRKKALVWYFAEVQNPNPRTIWFKCTINAHDMLADRPGGISGNTPVPFGSPRAEASVRAHGVVGLTWYLRVGSFYSGDNPPLTYALHCKTLPPPS